MRVGHPVKKIDWTCEHCTTPFVNSTKTAKTNHTKLCADETQSNREYFRSRREWPKGFAPGVGVRSMGAWRGNQYVQTRPVIGAKPPVFLVHKSQSDKIEDYLRDLEQGRLLRGNDIG